MSEAWCFFLFVMDTLLPKSSWRNDSIVWDIDDQVIDKTEHSFFLASYRTRGTLLSWL
jgi:hypothetical protein